MPDQVRRTLPNLLTVARVLLAIGFFAIIAFGLWPRAGFDPGARQFWGNVGVVVFVVAALTDFADGFLARRWGVVSVFGRVMDPFGDKLLIIGTFVLLASPVFLAVQATPDGGLALSLDADGRVVMTSGVQVWMALVILGRELLVTSIRSVMEGLGIDFSAGWSGKWKMVLQSIAAPTALFVAVNPFALESSFWVLLRDGFVWAAVVVTVWSALPYLLRARLLVGEMESRS
ncbi:MAG: hypothetical protein CMJ23_13830 [Phycisphaerae bacterium]|nr:hypothetical protein [Phycisphaerae bacterium]